MKNGEVVLKGPMRINAVHMRATFLEIEIDYWGTDL